ncbi:MAG: DUF4336 domain-containing protein [Gammaproteobacteria bacterium]
MKPNDHITLYEPINVYKPWGDGIGIVDGPLVYMSYPGLPFLHFPFPTRMTVVQLQNGDLWLHSPTAHTPELAEALSKRGRVAHLVSPNLLHYANIPAWKARFPEAVAWASPGVRKRAGSQHIDVRFDRELDAEAIPETWKDDLKQAVVPGKLLDEFVYFHEASKTLILTDTIQNFELDKLRQPYRALVWLARAYAPHGQMPLDLRSTFLFNRTEIREAAREMLSWRPESIILSHGKNIGHDAPAAIRRTFRFALRGQGPS